MHIFTSIKQPFNDDCRIIFMKRNISVREEKYFFHENKSFYS